MKTLEEIREYISCPQFGDDHYGKWGALTLEQRATIYDLINFVECDDIEIKRLKQENVRLNNLINTIFDFNFFKEECPLNFGFSDENEEKSQNVFYEDDYCEKNCNDVYKKCWLKYFERLQKLKEGGKNNAKKEEN